MKMLLVDDDPVSRTAFAGIFGPPPGWEIVETEDGQQALELLHRGLKPEFCVVDLLMPTMNGLEFLEQVRKDPYLQHLKVVATSSKRDRETILSLAKLQVCGYLLKPFDVAKVKTVLQPLIAGNPGKEAITKKPARHTLLAVDDDPVMREVIAAFLGSTAGWDVKFAVDGNDAFECLYDGLRPDLIITDLNMANVDGVALIKRIRKDRNFESVKVAVISGAKEGDNNHELAALDLYAFLQKPVDAAKFTNLLRRISG